MIETIVPIPIDQLKKYFQDKDNVKFVLDYDASTLKGAKFLTYISNLDVPADVKFDVNNPDHEELLEAYFSSPNLTSLASLEEFALKVLLQIRGLEDFGFAEFIQKHMDVIKPWLDMVDSLPLYNVTTLKLELFDDFTKEFPRVEDTAAGINFVNMLKYEAFFILLNFADAANAKYYSAYFETPMFKGKTFFAFWANPNNPMFLLTNGIATGEITAGDQP